MKQYVKIILTCLSCFCVGFVLGLQGCRSEVKPLASSVTAEKNKNEVDAKPDVKVDKTADFVKVTKAVNTERYGKIVTETVFQRQDFAYTHCLALNAYVLNTDALLGIEYRYKRFKIHALAGYNYRQSVFSYGLGIGYVIKTW